MWGSGSEGQLGLGMPDSELPTSLKFQDKIIDVACGYYHTAIVTGKHLHIKEINLKYFYYYFIVQPARLGIIF